MNKRVLLIGIAIEELEKKILAQLEHFHGPNLDLVPIKENEFDRVHNSPDSPNVAVIPLGSEQHIVGLVDHSREHFAGETHNGLIRLVRFGSSYIEPDLDSL